MSTIFKIKRIRDGKFSGGGSIPKFSKNGKIWTGQQYLKAHLDLIMDYKNMYMYDGCQIIEYVLTEDKIHEITDVEFRI